MHSSFRTQRHRRSGQLVFAAILSAAVWKVLLRLHAFSAMGDSADVLALRRSLKRPLRSLQTNNVTDDVNKLLKLHCSVVRTCARMNQVFERLVEKQAAIDAAADEVSGAVAMDTGDTTDEEAAAPAPAAEVTRAVIAEWARDTLLKGENKQMLLEYAKDVLKDTCRAAGLRVGGSKTALADRLWQHWLDTAAPVAELADGDTTPAGDNEFEEVDFGEAPADVPADAPADA